MYNLPIETLRNEVSIHNTNNKNKKKTRRFINMNKEFNTNNVSKTKNNKLFKIYNNTLNTPDAIHNLNVPKLTIPFVIKILLSLGLGFSIPKNPNICKLSNELKTAILFRQSCLKDSGITLF